MRARSGTMGFSIDHGGVGLFGGILIALLIGAGAIVLVFFLSIARQAHDDVVEEEGDDPDRIV